MCVLFSSCLMVYRISNTLCMMVSINLIVVTFSVEAKFNVTEERK